MSNTDWTLPFAASYRYMRVSRKTGEEIERVYGIKAGGTITRNRDTSIKQSATFEASSYIDLGADYLRVYMDCDFLGKQDNCTECLGTYLLSQPQRDIKSGYYNASITAYSVLQILADAQFEGVLILPKGTNPVTAAKEIIEACGLEVIADSYDGVIEYARTYGIGDENSDGSKLECVNDLMDSAGFSAAVPDAYGRVLLKRYYIPSERKQTHAFVEGKNARFLPEMTEVEDRFGVANCVKVIYSNEEGYVIGTARDDDPSSPYSTVNVGREVWRVDRPSYELTQEEATARAQKLLQTENNARKKVQIDHTYVPLELGDIVMVDYPSGGINEEKFFVRTMTYDLSKGGCLMQSNIKTFNQYDDAETEGE
jgi:hypothetical protein